MGCFPTPTGSVGTSRSRDQALKGRGGRRASQPDLSAAGLQAALTLLHTTEAKRAVQPKVDIFLCRIASLRMNRTIRAKTYHPEGQDCWGTFVPLAQSQWCFILFFNVCLFPYLAGPGLSCCRWDLVPRPGIEPRPPALGAWRLSHWPTREVPSVVAFFLPQLSLLSSGRLQDSWPGCGRRGGEREGTAGAGAGGRDACSPQQTPVSSQGR